MPVLSKSNPKKGKISIMKSVYRSLIVSMALAGAPLMLSAQEAAPSPIEMPAELTKVQPTPSAFFTLNCSVTETSTGYALNAEPNGSAGLTSAVAPLNKAYSTELFIKVSLRSDSNAALRLGFSETKQPVQIIANKAGQGIRITGQDLEKNVQVDSGYGKGDTVELSIHVDLLSGDLTVVSGNGAVAKAKMKSPLPEVSHFAYGSYDFSAEFSPLMVAGQ